jgi:hypothetical protein
MTINFSGFKNTGVTELAGNGKEVFIQRIWFQLTNERDKNLDEFAPLLKKYPDKDGFVKIDISAPNIPIEDSFISINDKKIDFDALTEENIGDIEQIRTKILPKISHPFIDLPVENTYLSGDKPYHNINVKNPESLTARDKSSYDFFNIFGSQN